MSDPPCWPELDNISSEGDVTAVLTWTGAPGDNPPDTVYVQETSSTFAYPMHFPDWVYAASPDLIPVVAVADDGLGDAESHPYYEGAACSGSLLTSVATSGRRVVRLPTRHLTASISYADAAAYGPGLDEEYEEINLDYSAQITGPPKSILILRPENDAPNVEKDKYIMGGSGEWQGSGDSRFDNRVYYDTEQTLYDGLSLDWEDWNAALPGSPWPPQYSIFTDGDTNGDWSRFWHWYAEGGTTGLGSDEGNTYDIHTFTPHIRPHVDWPYNASLPNRGYIPHDLLDEMESSNAPQSQTVRVNLHLTDTDLTNQHPEYNFDHHSDFRITYHNEYELISEGQSSFLTSADLPWQILNGPNGQPISQAAYAAPIQGWSPQLQAYVEANWQVNVNFVSWAGFSAGQNNGSGTTISVPAATIPANSIGVVYYRPHKVRIPFTYRHYLPAGREIRGYDLQGNEMPFNDHVDRSPFGFGTYPVDYIIFTFGNNMNPIPPSINHDPGQ